MSADQGERRRTRERRRAAATIDPGSIHLSSLIGADRIPVAVTIRATVGGMTIEIDMAPDVPALLALATDIIALAENLTTVAPLPESTR